MFVNEFSPKGNDLGGKVALANAYEAIARLLSTSNNEVEKKQSFDALKKAEEYYVIICRETSKYYRIQVEIPGNDNRYLIYVSTIIRYIYEPPFSIAVYCAMKNRHSFPELNIIQIVQFYIGAFCDKRPCHHFGNAAYTFSNIDVKCQFNLIKDYFNDCCAEKFVELTGTHTYILEGMQVFPIKILPQISDCINDLANIVYEKNKKRICCW